MNFIRIDRIVSLWQFRKFRKLILIVWINYIVWIICMRDGDCERS